MSSVTVLESIDTILEAHSHFAKCFTRNRHNFMPNGVLQIINIFVAHREHSSFQKLSDTSRDIACFRADNLGFLCTASLTSLIFSWVLADRSQFCYCSHASEVRHPPWYQFVVMLKWVRNALWVSMIEKSFDEMLGAKIPMFRPPTHPVWETVDRGKRSVSFKLAANIFTKYLFKIIFFWGF